MDFVTSDTPLRHQDDGHDMGPRQHAETRQHADDDGDDGLHVVVDSDDGGPENLLCLDNQDVTDERAEDDHIGRLQRVIADKGC